MFHLENMFYQQKHKTSKRKYGRDHYHDLQRDIRCFEQKLT